MKRIGYLYDKMCDVDLIKEAIHNAAKEKMHYAHVRKIVTNDDKYAQKIKYILKEESFEPSPYINDVIKQKTKRDLKAEILSGSGHSLVHIPRSEAVAVQ